MDDKDPGNQWAEKPLSVRLEQIKNQWINLGDRQRLMLDNLILSAEWLEEKVKKLEASSAVSEKERIDPDNVVGLIVEDIKGRNGIGDEWSGMDSDIRQEIIATWKGFFK